MSIPFDPPRPRPAGGGGGAAGFTAVLHTGRWNSNTDQNGNTAIVPDDVIENEGMTPGNGTQNVPYGVSATTNQGFGNVGRLKVSEEMAGIYTFTVSVNAIADSASYDEGPSVQFERFLLGRAGGNAIPVLAANNTNRAHQTDQHTFIFSVTTRLLPEEELQYKWTTSFKLKGNNAPNPGGWFSIAKIAS